MKAVIVEYHIVPNGHCWDVDQGDTFTGSFAYDMKVAKSQVEIPGRLGLQRAARPPSAMNN